MTRVAIVCAGRAVSDELAPIGKPCGRRLATNGHNDPAQQARAAGWAAAPDGTYMCPTCRRPPQPLAELARQRAIAASHDAPEKRR